MGRQVRYTYNTCIVLVAVGLIAAVVIMTRGATNQNTDAYSPSSGLIEYISSTKGKERAKNKASSPRSRALRVDRDAMDIGEYRRERMDAYLAERAKCDDRSQSTGWVSVDMDGTDVEYDLIWRQKQSNQPYL